MRRTNAHSGPTLSVLRDARVTLASLAASAFATSAVLASTLGEQVRDWPSLTPQRPVHVGVGKLWLDNTRTLPWPLAAVTVTWWPRARHVLDVPLSVVLGANVLLVAAALLGLPLAPLLRLAPGHCVLEFLTLATAVAAYLGARRAGGLRTHILTGWGAATVALLLGAPIFENATA
jgi:hypothetical protein